MDFITKLPKSEDFITKNKFDSILVIVDKLIKYNLDIIIIINKITKYFYCLLFN